MTTKLKYTKATKSTFVYVSEDADAAIPTLYIKKSALPNPAPESITVTIEVDNG